MICNASAARAASGSGAFRWTRTSTATSRARSPTCCSARLEGKGDHILAARFLNRFVPEALPWVHLDLAASDRKGGLAHVPTEFTGFGVRYASRLLADPAFLGRLERP